MALYVVDMYVCMYMYSICECVTRWSRRRLVFKYGSFPTVPVHTMYRKDVVNTRTHPVECQLPVYSLPFPPPHPTLFLSSGPSPLLPFCRDLCYQQRNNLLARSGSFGFEESCSVEEETWPIATYIRWKWECTGNFGQTDCPKFICRLHLLPLDLSFLTFSK